MIAKLSSVWKSNIVGSCHSFLDSTSDCISQIQEVVERDVRGTVTIINILIITYIKTCISNIVSLL